MLSLMAVSSGRGLCESCSTARAGLLLSFLLISPSGCTSDISGYKPPLPPHSLSPVPCEHQLHVTKKGQEPHDRNSHIPNVHTSAKILLPHKHLV